ncbi:HtrA protease/chaperone protein / Serine protease (Protease DO) [hydrothermal vent metagenome]|uniref:HtrA protease/chaperone protein / Serine protease (Protease DO) n=1 Tax=hydrothermal vent metagenome TaxID=652676 RepID=A0A1W1CNX2_9ZZZZ
MIKRTLLITALLNSVLFSATVSFKNAPKSPKHRLPNSQNEILSFNSILKNSINSVVNISTRTINYQGNLNRQFFREFFGNSQLPPQKSENSLGSGVIISKDGYIVTNNHVVEGADEISVTINHRDREFIAKVIGCDKGSDLAVIKIEADNLEPITFSYANDVQLGDVVFAIGNPFGVGQTVTQGIISALNKYGVGINQYENFIQTDASINPGNSGGALIDSRGDLIGINSAILSQSGGNHGIGFSIPVNMVRNIVSKLILDGKVERGFMGVNISKVTQELKSLYKHQKGAIITDVQANSPAKKSKLRRGDLIYAINGKDIKNPHDLQQIVTSFRPHETIKLAIERDGKAIERELKLGNIDGEGLALSSIDKSFEGLYINGINDTNRKKFGIPATIAGVVIEKVDLNSQAYIDGFSAGDIIIQIENLSIENISDAIEAFKQYRGITKRIYINRRGAIMLVVTK